MRSLNNLLKRPKEGPHERVRTDRRGHLRIERDSEGCGRLGQREGPSLESLCVFNIFVNLSIVSAKELKIKIKIKFIIGSF